MAKSYVGCLEPRRENMACSSFLDNNYPGKRPQTVCVSVHLREAKVNSHDICSRISASGSFCTTCWHLCKISLRISVWGSFWTTCIRILQDHLYKISVSGSFGPLASGSYTTTCARSLYRDPSGPLYRDPVGQLYQDPVGQLVQDLCFRISVWGSFGPLVSGSCRSTCTRSLLWGHLCKISVSGLLDHLYQGPVGPLLQDLCMRILLNDLYQDPFQPLVQDLS